jgi:hypothetical protein
MTSEAFSSRVHSSTLTDSSLRRLTIGFLNWGHGLDHFVVAMMEAVESMIRSE